MNPQPNPDPSPEQIRDRCAEIQCTWSDEEHHKRLRVDWRPMYRGCDGERETISSEVYSEHHSQAPRC